MKTGGLAGLLGADSAGEEEMEDEGAESGELEAAAEDLIAATKKGDAAAVASAFKAMHTICAEGYGE